MLLAAAAGCGETAAPIRVEDAWARPARAAGGAQATSTGQGMMGTGAVYGVIVNRGSDPVRLVGGRTDAAAAVEIHETRMAGDVMGMMPVAGGLEIPAGGRLELEPGGYHVMLIGLRRDLNAGDRLEVVLEFDTGAAVTINPEVREP